MLHRHQTYCQASHLQKGQEGSRDEAQPQRNELDHRQRVSETLGIYQMVYPLEKLLHIVCELSLVRVSLFEISLKHIADACVCNATAMRSCSMLAIVTALQNLHASSYMRAVLSLGNRGSVTVHCS